MSTNNTMPMLSQLYNFLTFNEEFNSVYNQGILTKIKHQMQNTFEIQLKRKPIKKFNNFKNYAVLF